LHVCESSARNKSLFASFSLEKEDLFFFEKEPKRLLFSARCSNKIGVPWQVATNVRRAGDATGETRFRQIMAG
jgi:hypothetical protein